MWQPSIQDRIHRKARQIFHPMLVPIRRNRLNNTDFTIISNNCWGGITYEYFGLQKASPTIGLWFFAGDYLKFLKRLDYYLNQSIVIIDPRESTHYNRIVDMKSESGLVGKLGDIEIILLHYHDKQLAKEKWERRVQRINPNNLIVKFSYMNYCTYEMLREFDELDLSYFSTNYKKIMFVPRIMPEFKCSCYFPGFEQETQILNDTYIFDKAFRIIPFINGSGIIAKYK